MLQRVRIIGILICTASLSACMSYNPNGYTNNRSYVFQGEPIYPESYDDGGQYNYYRNYRTERKEVVVPDSYYVGPARSPTSHKDQDKNWVTSQNAQNYTIEVGESDQPAQVASTLSKAPQKDRRAEVQYQRDGKTYYKGLYGSYGSYEAAQEALNTLPTDVKQSATVKSWGSVQNSVNE